MRRIACLLVLCLSLAPAHGQQDPAPVKKAIENWLNTQTKDLPGQVSLEIGGIDPANQLAPCTAFDISRPSGAQAWGRTNVMVRCLGQAGWRVHVPVHVRIKTNYLISARPIPQGQIVVEEDLATQSGDLSELPARTLTDARLAVGKVAAAPIPAGRPLHADMVKALTVIRLGQTVKVISRGAGFEVASEGRALNNAAEGQLVQVRLNSGQVVSGMAKSSGSIEVNH